MVQITLPDGSQRDFPGPVTVAEVAAAIGSGLAKAALAGKLGDKVVDTSYRIESSSPLAINPALKAAARVSGRANSTTAGPIAN